jgi:hypothetical protein
MTITTFMLTVLFTVGVSGLENFNTTSFSQRRDSLFLETYNRIDQYVRVAIDFPTTYDPEPSNPNNPVYTADADTVIMKLYSTNSDGTNCETSNDYLVYDKQGTNLNEILVAASGSSRTSHNQIVTRNVSSVNFTQTKQSAEVHRIVTAKIGITQSIPGRTIISQHSEDMVARND